MLSPVWFLRAANLRRYRLSPRKLPRCPEGSAASRRFYGNSAHIAERTARQLYVLRANFGGNHGKPLHQHRSNAVAVGRASVLSVRDVGELNTPCVRPG